MKSFRHILVVLALLAAMISIPTRLPVKSISVTLWGPDVDKFVHSSVGELPQIRDPRNRRIHIFTEPPKIVSVFAWSPDNTRIVFSDGVGTLKIQNMATGQVIGPVSAHNEGVMEVAWRPNADELATVGGDGLVKIWNGSNLTLIRQFVGAVPGVATNHVDWNPAGDKLAVGTTNGGVSVFSLNGTIEFARTEHRPTSVDAVKWLSNNHLISMGGVPGLIVWDVASDQIVSSINVLGVVASADINPAGDRIAAADVTIGGIGNFSVWNLTTGQNIYSQNVPNKSFRALDWSPDGNYIATESDTSVDIWNAANGQLIQSVTTGHNVWGIAWDATGRSLAYGNDTGGIEIIELPASSVWSISTWIIVLLHLIQMLLTG